jgi:hypothetical protein
VVRELAQARVDQRHQLIDRGGVAAIGADEEVGDICHSAIIVKGSGRERSQDTHVAPAGSYKPLKNGVAMWVAATGCAAV